MYFLTVELNSVILTVVLTTVDLIGFGILGWQTLVKDYSKLFPKDTSDHESIDADEQTELDDRTSLEANTITLK